MIKNMQNYSYERQHDNNHDMALAMCYVPIQATCKMYEDLKEAFLKGTIFPQLYKPFTGRKN